MTILKCETVSANADLEGIYGWVSGLGGLQFSDQ